MENDGLNNCENLSTEFYKPDYFGQNLNNNAKFQNWKKEMIIKYGNNFQIILCYNDNIFFYIDKKKNNRMNRYKCPICNKYICFYCLNILVYREDCCFKSRIKRILFESAERAKYISLRNIDFSILIPFISFLYIIVGIYDSLFFKLKRPVTYKKEHELPNIFYLDHLNYYTTYINVYFGLTLMIPLFPFIILDTFIIIFLLFISIPFKFYPIKFVSVILCKITEL